jgi:hypothetical protein
MNNEQFIAGIDFFTDPIFGLEPNVYLIRHQDPDVQPIIMSHASYKGMLDITNQEQARFVELQGMHFGARVFEINQQVQQQGDAFLGVLPRHEQLEYAAYNEHSTLQKKLRIARGPNQGNALPNNAIICPITRGLILDQDKLDASLALRIFSAAAIEQGGFNLDGLEDITHNPENMMKARDELAQYRAGAIELDPVLAEKLRQFSIAPVPQELPVNPELLVEGMSQENFNEGVDFFMDPVTRELDPNSSFYLYPGQDQHGVMLSQGTVAHLRDVRGRILCPLTRYDLQRVQGIASSNAMGIFVAAAHASNFDNAEENGIIAEYIAAHGEDFLQGQQNLAAFSAGRLEITPVLEAKLATFGIIRANNQVDEVAVMPEVEFDAEWFIENLCAYGYQEEIAIDILNQHGAFLENPAPIDYRRLLVGLTAERAREQDLIFAEAARIEAAREAARIEAARIEAAREAARIEAARIEAARIEAARIEAARIEAARVEAARAAQVKQQGIKIRI